MIYKIDIKLNLSSISINKWLIIDDNPYSNKI